MIISITDLDIKNKLEERKKEKKNMIMIKFENVSQNEFVIFIVIM